MAVYDLLVRRIKGSMTENDLSMIAGIADNLGIGVLRSELTDRAYLTSSLTEKSKNAFLTVDAQGNIHDFESNIYRRGYFAAGRARKAEGWEVKLN